MAKQKQTTQKLIYNPKPKKTLVLDETPNNREMILGLLLGVGYLTIFTVIPYLTLLLFFQDQLSDTLLASLAQIIAAIITMALMLLVSRRVITRVLKGFSLESIKLGLSYAGVMYLISIVYGLFDMYVLKNSTVNANQQELIRIANDSPLTFLILAVIIAPLIEELIFRYYLYKKLESKGFILATIVSTFLFSIIHILPSLTTNTFAQDIFTLPAYLLPSLVFAFAYYQTEKLAVPIFAHVAFNLVSAIVILLPITI